MNLYRIANKTYADDLNSPGGLYGSGRWHKEGTQILYTSGAASLAMLDVLGHWQKTPMGLVLVTLSISENATINVVEPDFLPAVWRELSYLPALADLTQQWIQEGKFWIMRVPSLHSPTEFNYRLNPLHPEHATLKLISVEPHPFYSRLK